MDRILSILEQHINVKFSAEEFLYLEIIIVLLMGFIVGMAVVWSYNRLRISNVKKEVKKFNAGLMLMKDEYEKLRKEKEKAVQAVNSVKNDNKKLAEDYLRMRNEFNRFKTESLSEKPKPFTMVTKQKDEIKELKEKIEKLQLLKEEYAELNNVYHIERKSYQEEIRELKNVNQVLKSETERQMRDIDDLYKKNYKTIKSETAVPKPVKPNGKDDLKQIRGIGAAIERKLNDIGIKRIDQIAKLKTSDIEKITQKIKFFPGRIERENWVFQAKEIIRVGSQKMNIR
ncbi:MAG: hypothetical protein V1647_00455 [Pseudomonadota bacterium]